MENEMRKMGQGNASQAQIDAEWRAFWSQNDRELAQEQAQRSKAIARLGVKTAIKMEATSRHINQDLADEREISRLKSRGASEGDRRRFDAPAE